MFILVLSSYPGQGMNIGFEPSWFFRWRLTMDVELCRLLESESQESQFLPFFGGVAWSDSFFNKSQLSNSRNLSFIHTT